MSLRAAEQATEVDRLLIVLKITRGLYNALAGSGDPRHLAFGLLLGLLLGLTPLGALEPLTYLCVLLLLATRAGIGLVLAVAGVAKGALLLGADAATAWVGFQVLEGAGFLRALWSKVLDLPVLGLFGFERYALMGGVVCAIALGAALWVPVTRGVVAFRERVAERLGAYRLVRWLRSAWFVRALSFVFKG